MFKKISLRAKLIYSFTLIILLLAFVGFAGYYALTLTKHYSDIESQQQQIVTQSEILARFVYNIRFFAMRGVCIKDMRVPPDGEKEQGKEYYNDYLVTGPEKVALEAKNIIEAIRGSLDSKTEQEDIARCDQAIQDFEHYGKLTSDWARKQDEVLQSADFRMQLAANVKNAVERIINRVDSLIERDKKVETLADGKEMTMVPVRLVGRQQRLGYILEKIELLQSLSKEQITISDSERRQEQSQKIDIVFTDMDQRLDTLAKEFTTAESAKDAKEAEENYNTWKQEIVHYDQLILEQSQLFDEMGNVANNVVEKTSLILQNAQKMAQHGDENFDKTSEIANASIMTVCLLSVLIGLALGWGLSSHIAGAMTRVTRLLKKVINEGDVRIQVDPSLLKRGDEVGELSRTAENVINDYIEITNLAKKLANGDWTASVNTKSDHDEMNIHLNRMIEKVNEVLYEVTESSENVTVGSKQIAISGSNLAKGAANSSANLEEISASMQQMGGQTKRSTEHAKQANQIAQESIGSAVQGKDMMQKMMDSMQKITQHASEVKQVIKVIDDIAFQTNLLALNAAVEAARAGTHGKGFAVVAEEVRNLAARSAKAAHETTQMIETNNRQISEGADVAMKTANVLQTITDQITETAKLIGEISKSSVEQAEGINQISKALEQIDSVTQQNTANAEETAGVSQEMSRQTESLQQLVNLFQLKNKMLREVHEPPRAGVVRPDHSLAMQL